MAINLTVNGQTYSYPETSDTNWGNNATSWAQAVTQGMLQKAGGLFTLLSDADFGATYGLVSTYYKTRSNDIATTGEFRLSASDVISFRHPNNVQNLNLQVDGSGNLTFNSLLLNTGYTASRVIASSSSGQLEATSVSTTLLNYLTNVTSDIQTQINSKLNLSGGTLTGALSMSNQKITSVGTPTSASDVATKSYVDNAITGLKVKTQVVAATTAPGTLATSFENGDTIDGVVLATGNRILIKDQASAVENGIYTVNASGAPTRSTDADDYSELFQAYVFVQGGSTNIFTGWLSATPNVGTINVDPVNFNLFSQAGTVTTDNQGVQIVGPQISLVLDGTTLSKSGSGLKVNEITNSNIATSAAIAVSKLAASGTNGQVLTTVSGATAWANAPIDIVAVSSNITAANMKTYLVDTTSARSIQLPAASANFWFRVKDKTGNADVNNITIVRASTERIEGIQTNKIMQTAWGYWTFVCDGTNWFII